MQNVPSAAGDPIFYMHHCQIDRVYASWEAEAGVSYNWGNSNTQPDESTWKTIKMGAFVDEDGQLVKVKLGDAINTSSLGYVYDALAQPPSPEVVAILEEPPRQTVPLTLAAMETQGFSVQSGGTTVTLAPKGETEAMAPEVKPSTAHTLVLNGIKLLRRPPVLLVSL